MTAPIEKSLFELFFDISNEFSGRNLARCVANCKNALTLISESDVDGTSLSIQNTFFSNLLYYLESLDESIRVADGSQDVELYNIDPAGFLAYIG
jgi:hypothetical protein